MPASCYHRGMGERWFELRASTARRVARFCSTQKCVRILYLHPELDVIGCLRESEEIEGYVHRVGRRGVRHPSCLLVCAYVCHLIIWGGTSAGSLGPYQKTAVCHDHSISADPDRAQIAHHFSPVAEPLLLVLIAQWPDKLAHFRQQQNLLASSDSHIHYVEPCSHLLFPRCGIEMLLEGILKSAQDRTSIVVMQRVSTNGDSVHNFG